ncbi:uncharacterized protein [Bemisia tabaci]|uniref:uncharacterized protein n=1 Tax=Bemisia tabaci TaxID=7038 RepID=UPI003B283B40
MSDSGSSSSAETVISLYAPATDSLERRFPLEPAPEGWHWHTGPGNCLPRLIKNYHLQTFAEDTTPAPQESSPAASGLANHPATSSAAPFLPVSPTYQPAPRFNHPTASTATYRPGQPPAATACNFCGDRSHISHRCPELSSCTPEGRYERVIAAGRCVNCFGSHRLPACKSPRVCQSCGGRHHSLLHGFFEKPKTLPPQDGHAPAEVFQRLAERATAEKAQEMKRREELIATCREAMTALEAAQVELERLRKQRDHEVLQFRRWRTEQSALKDELLRERAALAEDITQLKAARAQLFAPPPQPTWVPPQPSLPPPALPQVECTCEVCRVAARHRVGIPY